MPGFLFWIFHEVKNKNIENSNFLFSDSKIIVGSIAIMLLYMKEDKVIIKQFFLTDSGNENFGTNFGMVQKSEGSIFNRSRIHQLLN